MDYSELRDKKNAQDIGEYRNGKAHFAYHTDETKSGERQLRKVTKYLADEWLRGTRVIRFILCAVLIYYIGLGGRNAYVQHIRLQNCVPLEAEILQSSTQYKRAKDRFEASGYSPMVRFRYTIAANTYTSDCLTSMKRTVKWSKERAEEFVKKYPIGKKVTAYCLPTTPERAFLVKSYVSLSYCQGVVFLSIVLCFLVWIGLQDDYKDRYRFWKCLALCLYWLTVGIVCYGYYFYYAERPYSIWVIIRCLVYLGLGLLWVFQTFYSKFYLLPRGLRWKNR